MIIHGEVLDANDEIMLISAPFPSYLIEKRNIKTVEVVITDGRRITSDQRKKIYATIRDISLYTGHDPEELKGIFKADYVAKTGEQWFSLSNVDMTTANGFLQHLVDFCIEWGIPTQGSYLERSPDVSRYLYMCLATRTCAVCGKKAEVHHSGESKVGMGRNRAKINHLGLMAVALCREHHEWGIHTMPEAEFYEKYHIWAIKLDEYLCKGLGLKI